MKKILPFKGACVAIVTPFNENGINFEELGRMIDFQIENGTDAICITGTTGEAATMNNAEHCEATKFAVVQAVLLVTPYYNKCTQAGLVAHYKKIADTVDIPCIVYNVPGRTGVNIKPETYVKLAEHPRIVAVKEANGDLTSVLRTRKLCGDELAIYSGNDDQIIPILSLGGSGVISVLSNVAPRDTHLICQNYFDGKVDEASRMQVDYCDLIDALFCEVNPIPVKVAMRLMGWNVGELRMPLCEPEPAHVEQIKAALKAHNLLK